jgi:class 3 adenylate cyclase
VFDIAMQRELTELIGKSLTFTDIETIGGDIFKSYSTHRLENVSDSISISPLNAAKRLVSECESKNKLKDLFSVVIRLDGNMLNGRIVELSGLENLLYHLSKTGLYFDFDRHKLVSFDQEKELLINWGSLKDGKEYPIVVASVDICENSKLVKKNKPKVMEKVYYELWEYLQNKLHLYDGRIWSWAGDGGILAFRERDNVSECANCCLEILLSLPAFNLMPAKPIGDDIVLRIGMDCGKIKFYKDTGRIVSDVINYAAHLEKQGTEPNGLSVSDMIYRGLSPSLKKIFKTKHEFEGRTAYSLVYDCASAFV